MTDALISIKPVFVRRIMAGSKIVEIRRRTLRMVPGTRLWIYATRPEACLRAVARVHRVTIGSPAELWPQLQEISGISAERFFLYCKGQSTITAIFLQDVERLERALSLSALRAVLPDFHPPQFFSWLPANSELLRVIDRVPRETIRDLSPSPSS